MAKFLAENLYLIDRASLLQILDLSIKNVGTRIDGMDKALKVKEVETERRLEALNELRGDVEKDRGLLVKQETYELKMAGIDLWLVGANDKFTRLMTKYDNRFTTATVIAAISLIVSVIGIVVLIFFRKG
jgi:hypothetical protein